jgi:hypothetical protein
VPDRRLGSIEDVGRKGSGIRVVGTRLNQQHSAARILAQSRSDYASGRTAADDDHVEFHGGTIMDRARLWVASWACHKSLLSASAQHPPRVARWLIIQQHDTGELGYIGSLGVSAH